MIESIVLKNVATYDTTGVQLDDLKPINLIYGANGSGKTTVSRFLQNHGDPKFSGCSIQWKAGQQITTLVYNKEFREQNFGKGKINGVFTLGQATVDEKKNIEEKEIALKIIKENIGKTRASLDAQRLRNSQNENWFKEHCWTTAYKKYEQEFKPSFIGFQYKEKFKEKLISEFISNTAPLLTLNELQAKALTIFGKHPQTIPLFTTIAYEQLSDLEISPIWKKTIVGKGDVDIAKLIQRMNLNDWVNQGITYLQEDEDTCPFCQHQTITKDFRDQVEAFFDDTYLDDIKVLKEMNEAYTRQSQNLISELNAIETSAKDSADTKLDIERYSAYLKTFISQHALNAGHLITKLKEPSRSVELVSSAEQLTLLAGLVEAANAEIGQHNKLVSNLNVEKETLKKAIWRFLVEECQPSISKFNDDKSDIQKAIAGLASTLKKYDDASLALDAEIKHLNKNVTSIQPTVDEINRLLKAYGFHNFKIVPAAEAGFYKVEREDGAVAEHTLSEGEVTFITFLYYLQLSKGATTEDKVNEERILVVDDPICSLDSNILFVVSTLIRDIIKAIKEENGNIRQIILLTHNVYFHKEVSFEKNTRSNGCAKTHFWILEKNENTTRLQPYGIRNPIQSSYGLLWNELKNENIKSSVSIQNIMRRIIENYFKLLGQYVDDDLINQFTTYEEKEICRSLLSWINDGSHNINDDLFVEHPGRTIESYRKVFKQIFVVTNHEGHYDMMYNEKKAAV